VGARRAALSLSGASEAERFCRSLACSMMPYRVVGPELPFYEYVRQNFTGLPQEVQVHPTPDRLAKLRFPINGEHPLVLVDDTIMQSAKVGILLTTNALYSLADGQRLDLSLIRGGPHYPNGEDEAGFIDTPNGPFAVPQLTQDYARGALHRMVEIVVAWNHGERTSAPAELALRGPVTRAALHVLHAAPKVLTPWGVSRKKREGIRLFSRGMDHPSGEELLAVIDETTLGKGDEGVVFTDRAVHVRNEAASSPNDFFNVPYAHIQNVTPKRGLLERKLVLATSLGPREITLITAADAADAVHRFFMTVLQMPPHQRHDPRPPNAPLLGDRVLHTCVDGLGLTPEVAGDLHARLVLQHQNEQWGRGERQGWAFSPLSLGDLRAALPYVLGQPVGEHWDGTVMTLDFSLPMNIGLAMFATVGIGWISVPKGPKISTVRCRAYAQPGGSGIRVTGIANHAELEAPAIANAVDSGLVRVEQEILRRRCILGPDMAAAELLSVDDDSVARRAHELSVARSPAPTAGG